MTRIEKFAEHIIQLGEAFNVLVAIVHGMDRNRASAGPLMGKSAILVAPITDDETYAIALHEFGHLLAPLGSINSELSIAFKATHGALRTERDVNIVLMEEEAAWGWAIHYAFEWTPEMQRTMDSAMASYRSLKPHTPEDVVTHIINLGTFDVNRKPLRDIKL